MKYELNDSLKEKKSFAQKKNNNWKKYFQNIK